MKTQMKTQFLQRIFSFLKEGHIPFAVARSYASLPETIDSGDVDLLIAKEESKKLIQFFRTQGYQITSVARHAGTINLFVFLSHTEQLQIDLMFALLHNGMPYLDIDTVLSERIPYKDFYIPAPWHEYFLLLLPHFFYTGQEKEKYRQHMQELRAEHSSRITQLHHEIFGAATPSKNAFFLRKWGEWPRMWGHYSLEFRKYLAQPFCHTVAFLGPDGAGKSTALALLQEKNIQFSKTSSTTHLKPQHILKKRTQSRGVVTDPHAEEPRSSWTASLKLGVYVQEYWIEHFRHPQRNAHLKIYDRYVHDTMIDARRYRLAEKSPFPSWISRFAPQPVLFVVLDADPERIQSRKSEVSLEATRTQCASYLAFANDHADRTVIIDANQNAEKVVADIIDAMAKRLSEVTDAQLQEIIETL